MKCLICKKETQTLFWLNQKWEAICNICANQIVDQQVNELINHYNDKEEE